MDNKQDMVNHPPHYNNGNIEVIDMIEDSMNESAYMGYLWGNILKYMHRWPYKGGLQDLEKAQWYLNRLVEYLKQMAKGDNNSEKIQEK